MPLPIRKIALRRGDRSRLEQLVRARTTAYRVVERAQIVLASAGGGGREYDLCATAGLAADGLALVGSLRRGGRERTGSGSPTGGAAEADHARGRGGDGRAHPAYGASDRHALEHPAHGAGHGPSSCDDRTDLACARAEAPCVKQFKLSTDPEFVAKLRDVVGLYVHPPERAVVLAFDEKSQIQALDRTQPGLPLKKGRAGTMTHDYKRHGTTTRFAALDVATGALLQECMPRHRHQEFLKVLRQMEQSVAPDLTMHVILDNYATHQHAKVTRWLARHRRVHFHFTPTSASWLNLAERFFSELTQRQLRRLAVNSVDQLIAAITQYINRRNEHPTPFVWTATVRQILKKVNKANETLATLH